MENEGTLLTGKPRYITIYQKRDVFAVVLAGTE
jgi:hypothetical protein